MDRFEVAARLREIGAWIRFHGDRSYRARVFERGARLVEGVDDLIALARSDSLSSSRGMSEGLAAQIAELVERGTSRYLDQLRGDLPSSLLTLPGASGLSSRKVLQLYRTLGIKDEGGLVAAAAAGKLRAVRGFGDKSEQRILERMRGEDAGLGLA